MDDGETHPSREDLGELIENLIEAESSLLSARAMMLDSSLAQKAGYESIVEHVGDALRAAQSALAELHHKIHEA
ncbi:MAG: hypothetical protein M3317_02775 [Actinomycetota bacterium]|nr:hypothetical protein [Actinomycetota bacterium]